MNVGELIEKLKEYPEHATVAILPEAEPVPCHIVTFDIEEPDAEGGNVIGTGPTLWLRIEEY